LYWRLHLASFPIRNLHILEGSPAQLAVRDTRHKIRFYDLNTGGHYGDLEIDLDLLDNDIPEERREGLAALAAPNGARLPFVDFNTSRLYVSLDGDLRVIHDLNAGLTLEVGEEIIPLEMRGSRTAVRLAALDRELGTIAALTEDNVLHIFQQQMHINRIEMGNAQILRIFAPAGGGHILIVESDQLKLIDMTGKVQRSHELHYVQGVAALSQDGSHLVIADADHQLMRLYNRDLIPIRQQHAIDLLSEAAALQLFEETPSLEAPLVAVDVTNTGVLAFGMAGVLCVSHVDAMTELPQPRLLL